MTPANQNQIAHYLLHLYEDVDIIEVRLLRGEEPKKEIKKFWTNIIDVDCGLLNTLYGLNRQNWNIHIGVNPRREVGKATDAGIQFARCHFADFDGGVTPGQAENRIAKAGLPEPTMVVWSGHGTHCYWRLDEPVTDTAVWRKRQKALISKLNSDPAIHNPERCMRMPGFMNRKYVPVPCYIVSINGDLYAEDRTAIAV
jgi:hypothetical protein